MSKTIMSVHVFSGNGIEEAAGKANRELASMLQDKIDGSYVVVENGQVKLVVLTTKWEHVPEQEGL